MFIYIHAAHAQNVHLYAPAKFVMFAELKLPSFGRYNALNAQRPKWPWHHYNKPLYPYDNRMLQAASWLPSSMVYVAICSLFLFIERRLRSGFHSPRWLFWSCFGAVFCGNLGSLRSRDSSIYNNPSIVLESRGWWATFMLLFEIRNSKLQLPLGSTPARFPPRFPKMRG